ncbi:MAG: helix-turn-helix transcriptional regulator [Synergistes sp.]|nr:helix-turn-helix transcriptional regulator [Clostridia bacterium]MBQ9882558.1 helix-turn-helix transcriptional regulator [Synergistes sp.]
MKSKNEFTAKQVGDRIRERRTELRLSMGQLGDRLGVNKSTIQRYEANGIDPKKTYMIVSLSEALETTPEWLTGQSETKEYDSYTKCKKDIDGHIVACLEEMIASVRGEPHQQMLTTFLGNLVDLYAIFCGHFARAMEEVEHAAGDEGLKESIRRYAIEIGDITQRVYVKEMEAPIEDMKRFLDGLLHLYDEGRTRVSMGDLFEIKTEARKRLTERNNSVEQ